MSLNISVTRSMRSIVFLLIFPALLYSQIINGSFEDEGQPSLAGWNFTCRSHTTVQDSPLDTSGYCLKLEAGNFQGCFPGFAYQIIPDVKNGDVWQIEGWVKKITYFPIPGIGFSKLGGPGGFTALKVKNPATTEWEYLSVQDTFDISDQDTILIVLSAGSTSGSATGWSYFDLISVSKVISTEIGSEQSPDHFMLNQNYPNPFNSTTTFSFQLETASHARLRIYDLLGREIVTLTDEFLQPGTHNARWDAGDLPGGIYVYRLQTSGVSETRKLVLMK